MVYIYINIYIVNIKPLTKKPIFLRFFWLRKSYAVKGFTLK